MGKPHEILNSIGSKHYEKSEKANHELDFMFIGELAVKLGVNPKTIRYYEREGLLNPARHGKFRIYLKEDVDRLKVILAMRQLGVSIANIKALYDVNESSESNVEIRKILDGHLDLLSKQLKMTEDQLSLTRELMEEFEMSERNVA